MSIRVYLENHVDHNTQVEDELTARSARQVIAIAKNFGNVNVTHTKPEKTSDRDQVT